MAFQTPITVKDALDSISRHEYVLPAIQRELVWRPRQIEMLFDSLMRGYPIGSFLFWEVKPENTDQYRFYDFITDYDARDPHNRPLSRTPEGAKLIAVLDGQQRLTALNIGLYGSHTDKLPKLWWRNPEAFPKKRLYLNLLGSPEENDDGMGYDFRFFSEADISKMPPGVHWYLVSHIRDIRDENDDLIDFVHEHGLADTKHPQKMLARLHRIVHSTWVISFYKEKSQDLHKVLNIFVRTNSGGTVLSYSDMLLSVATAQWDRYDAREEIHGFVDELNRIGNRFSFSKDFVLKACLMLSDLDIEFRVTNFNADNMSRIQDEWERIKRSVHRTVQLAASIGYDSATLSSANSLLPVAYYLHRPERPDGWLTHDSYSDDRSRVRQWLIRALLKRGVWGSGLDTLLGGLRKVLQGGAPQFPVEDLENDMRRRGKSLLFDDAELEDLVDIRFGNARVYGVLTLLFAFVDVAKNQFHIDHIFPRAKLRRSALLKSGSEIEGEDIPEITSRVDGLANLQLLPGPENEAKRDLLPAEWLRRKYTDASSAEHQRNHALEGLPEKVRDFPKFYDRRRRAMLHRLSSLLSSRTSSVSR